MLNSLSGGLNDSPWAVEVVSGSRKYMFRIIWRCGVAQLVARRLAVRQARVRFSARHLMEVLLSEEAMRIQEDRPRRMMKDEWMYDCTVWMIVKNNKYQKEWHNATKPLGIIWPKNIQRFFYYNTFLSRQAYRSGTWTRINLIRIYNTCEEGEVTSIWEFFLFFVYTV